MKDKNYFDHNSPTYGSPFDMMKSFGISYTSAGENIAMGQKTPEEVVQAWMDSPGHRENIMNCKLYSYWCRLCCFRKLLDSTIYWKIRLLIY